MFIFDNISQGSSCRVVTPDLLTKASQVLAVNTLRGQQDVSHPSMSGSHSGTWEESLVEDMLGI